MMDLKQTNHAVRVREGQRGTEREREVQKSEKRCNEGYDSPMRSVIKYIGGFYEQQCGVFAQAIVSCPKDGGGEFQASRPLL